MPWAAGRCCTPLAMPTGAPALWEVSCQPSFWACPAHSASGVAGVHHMFKAYVHTRQAAWKEERDISSNTPAWQPLPAAMTAHQDAAASWVCRICIQAVKRESQAQACAHLPDSTHHPSRTTMSFAPGTICVTRVALARGGHEGRRARQSRRSCAAGMSWRRC